jgi:hypothetical protein
MSLSKIVEQIKAAQAFATEDVESGPIETLNGRRGRKNQAIQQILILKNQYKTELTESAAFIVVTGEKRDMFSSVASDKFDCFTANPNEFYESLAGRIPEQLYLGKEGLSGLFDVLGRHLEDKAGELGIIGYPQMIFRNSYRTTLKSKEDLVAMVRLAINDQVGPEMAGIQAIHSVLDAAIAKGHGAKVTPVVLSTDNETLALQLNDSLGKLHPKGVFLVVAGKGTKALRIVEGVISVKDPTEESVKMALTQISGVTKK